MTTQKPYFRSTNHGPRTTPSTDIPAKTGALAEESKVPSEIKKYNFRDLKVWQTAKEIAVIIYSMTKHLPKEELYGMSSQMQRAAISVSSNIAEGFNRFYKKDYQRYLMIALGSCGELESQIEVGIDLGYFDRKQCEAIIEKLNHENRMLRNLHSKLYPESKNSLVS